MTMDRWTEPTLAVVGHPNKGKSSIVSTLAEDRTVLIGAEAGTTVRARVYPMRVDGRVIYNLVDTPGFQRARTVLAWLQERATSADERRPAVEAFVEAHRGNARFVDECELLEPILRGAGILYVVDGSVPYGPEFEAEMEILRWTGQPSMALINLIGSDYHGEAWKNALNQYFRVVREFNAVHSEFSQRLALLRVFGELEPAWHEPLNEAISVLGEARAYLDRQAYRAIAEMMAEMLVADETKKISVEDSAEGYEDKLLETLKSKLRRIESTARRNIERIYRFGDLERQESSLPALQEDLFSEDQWYLWGLNRKELLGVGAVGGAVVGGALDVGIGGASLMLGSLVGAVVGGAAALAGSHQLAQSKVMNLPMGGKVLQCGPVRDRNFPYVVLARAIVHRNLVGARSHADRGRLEVSKEQSFEWSDVTTAADRARLERTIGKLRDGSTNPEFIDTLSELIAGVCDRVADQGRAEQNSL